MGNKTYDLAIIGGGIAGLAAAIVAASEGLDVVVIEGGMRFGGQAVLVKNVRNYPGFSVGISGENLVAESLAQARDFGVDLLAMKRVSSIKESPTGFVLQTSHREEFPARSVLITAGVRYRQLEEKNVSSFIGCGVHYGELPDMLDGKTVSVVGGGNSAGQAVVDLASRTPVTIRLLVRELLDTRFMSAYLVDSIRKSPRIEVIENIEVVGAFGKRYLEGLNVRDRGAEGVRQLHTDHLLVSIGADPRLAWAGDFLALDDKGYALTGSLAAGHPRWTDRPPPRKNESTPGIFVAGDARSDSIKRIGFAVGDAQGAVASVLQYLGRR